MNTGFAHGFLPVMIASTTPFCKSVFIRVIRVLILGQ